VTYAEKLKDPRWQRKRLQILERENFTCEQCEDKTKTLHVHHYYYVKGRDPWDYPDFALAVLCEECHEIAGNRQDEFLPFEYALQMLFHGTSVEQDQMYAAIDALRCNFPMNDSQFRAEILRRLTP
jgi:hypothetical protein